VSRHALLVGAGIGLSRVVGLVRQRVFSHYFGIETVAAEAWNAAFRIPNFLQNLFGEGVLSASFIPVYARLLAEKDDREAGRVAGAIGALLALVVSVIVLVGVFGTRYFIDAIAPGFERETRELTIRLVRILFPGAGLLVLSAWCLGILNSHRKFFLSYTAPVVWSAAMIAAMLVFGRRMDTESLVIVTAWASVAGSALMFLAQLPAVLRFAPRITFGSSQPAREVTRNFGPVFVSRGVAQISGYIDMAIASYVSRITPGAVAALGTAQTLYMLPVSLFGMSVSAAELPEMSSALAGAEIKRRLNAGLRQIAFFVVPSAMALAALGDVLTAGLFVTGRFKQQDAVYVWRILAGSAVGLVAQTLGRLYSSTYYALRDTRTPLRYAVIRVILTTVLGYLCAMPLGWGVPGLTASAGVAGWVEFTLLRLSLNRRIGSTGLPAGLVARLWGAAAAAAAAAWGVKLAVGLERPIVDAIAIIAMYGVVYFGATFLLGVEECRGLVRRVIPSNR
jgi:putative peptidoglycan lipid II flippase